MNQSEATHERISGTLSFRHSAGSLIAEFLYAVLSPRGDKPPSLTNGENPEIRGEENIRSILRRFPYWKRGHLLLGAKLLARKEKRGAYASALAAQQLAGSEDKEARFLLARVFLQSGREQQAKELLEELHRAEPGDHAVTEELAAAYMHFAKNDEARELLRGIPAEHLSPAGATALSWLTR